MSNATLIPREKLSAYQRWELHSFDSPGNGTLAAAARDTGEDAAAKLESVRRSAYQSGREDGLREGALQAADDARRLRDLFTSVTQKSRGIDQQLATDLLGLSLQVARQMVRRSLALHPETIIPLIEDALGQLSNASAQRSITLHPADAALARTHLAAPIERDHWRIVEDANMERGGCVLQTASSHLDATVGARWRHIAEKLGMDDTWLD